MIRKLIGRITGFQKEIDKLNQKIVDLSWDEPFGMWTRTAFLHVCSVMPRGSRVIAFIDIDDVHGLNGTYGYSAVDDKVKSAFSIPLRSSDLVARWYSGDEIVILFDTDHRGAERKINELQENALKYGITFQYVMGLWEVGRTSVVDVVDGLSCSISNEKKPHKTDDGTTTRR